MKCLIVCGLFKVDAHARIERFVQLALPPFVECFKPCQLAHSFHSYRIATQRQRVQLCATLE